MEPAVGGGCGSALEKENFGFKSGRNRWWSVLIRRLRGFCEVSFSKKEVAVEFGTPGRKIFC